ncbi:MAG TPA: NADH-quinone oxidoreductase subunit J [Oligoflexia bacterium]|nr:NADH-quinone oxidoreductase subunit J [Oligoflexia bacterium]
MAATDVFFYIFSAIGLLFALKVVMGKNPISSAFSLVLVFFCMAANFVLLEAHFIAAMQILVYAGALMVLFVFVIMLLNADVKSLDVGKKPLHYALGGAVCLALMALVVYALVNGTSFSEKAGLSAEKIDSIGGNAQVVSLMMFSDYILPFELTSILLLVGIVGSVALAKRRTE